MDYSWSQIDYQESECGRYFSTFFGKIILLRYSLSGLSVSFMYVSLKNVTVIWLEIYTDHWYCI